MKLNGIHLYLILVIFVLIPNLNDCFFEHLTKILTVLHLTDMF